MNVYVLGAGVSRTVGYPLGRELFQEIDKYIRACGPVFNRFHYEKDWPKLCKWLRENKNSLIAESYRTKQLEHIFTILDLASIMRSDPLVELRYAIKKGSKAGAKRLAVYQRFTGVIKYYEKYSQRLLWALEDYFESIHYRDLQHVNKSQWSHLKAFGQILCRGDMVITFNYDSTLERVLLQQGKWNPQDGYGFNIVLQKSAYEKARVKFPKSVVTTLHLHGAIGWYKKPILTFGHSSSRKGRAIPRKALTPAPLETDVSLGSLFLRDLGVQAVDASLPRTPPDTPIFLHPSFFKDYELEDGSTLFTQLWQKAAKALRAAEEIVIMGYSLPSADSAALTLLLTNCDRDKVRIVNSNKAANSRLRQLLSNDTFGAPQSLQGWLAHVSNCPSQ